MMDVLQSARYIAERSKSVSVSDEGVDAAAKYVLEACAKKPYTTAAWHTHELHPKSRDESALVWSYFT